MVGPNGLEPSTSSVSRMRSNQTELRAYIDGCVSNSTGWRVIRATLVGGGDFSAQPAVRTGADELRNALVIQARPAIPRPQGSVLRMRGVFQESKETGRRRNLDTEVCPCGADTLVRHR
jgi:hypothetical protein